MGAWVQEREQKQAQKGRWFAATHWSVVLAAGHGKPEARAKALETLCQTYWRPLYIYIRCLGHDLHDAEDLTQSFFAHLLSRNCLDSVGPAKGRFRSFLLVALKHFLADEWSRSSAAKRGGKLMFVDFDSLPGEDDYQSAARENSNPEGIFDRRWALTLLDCTFHKLEREFATNDKTLPFAQLSPFLSREGSAAEYETVAAKLGMKPGAVAVAVHRLRLRFREVIRAEIADTVAHPADIAEETRYLLGLICQ